MNNLACFDAAKCITKATPRQIALETASENLPCFDVDVPARAVVRIVLRHCSASMAATKRFAGLCKKKQKRRGQSVYFAFAWE